MDVYEKALARCIFQNKIYRSDGQSFQDLFVSIMNYAEESFQLIKPWGNIGDRKNDGYIRDKGIYFQVYAPENITKSYVSTINKLKSDFSGLKAQWSSINEFYFVVNDKYKGVNSDCEKAIKEIKDEHKLYEAKFKTAKDIENTLFTLDDDEIFSIIGPIPDPGRIKQLDFSVLSEVIEYIGKLPLKRNVDDDIILPDWGEKILFNKLSTPVARLLNSGYLQVFLLEEYLANNGDFLADTLRDKVNKVYFEERVLHEGDELFWAIVDNLSPRVEQHYQTTVIVIMAKYFETCDIFDTPSSEEKNDNSN